MKIVNAGLSLMVELGYLFGWLGQGIEWKVSNRSVGFRIRGGLIKCRCDFGRGWFLLMGGFGMVHR